MFLPAFLKMSANAQTGGASPSPASFDNFVQREFHRGYRTPGCKIQETKAQRGLTEAQIAVHWKEEEYFKPSKKFIAQANLAGPAFVKKFSEKHFPECFDHYANLLTWDKKW